MKKRIVSFVAVMSLVFAMSATAAFAASYTFKFEGSFIGSLKTSSAQTVQTLNAAYVNPSASAVPTTYYLCTTASDTTNVTNWITDVSTAGKRSFTYNSGYGGVNNQYKLAGYPSNWDFVDYTVTGSWSP